MGNNSNTEGGPHQTTEAPHGACEGCEKGKSKRLPFPTSWSRAKRPLDLVHSNLDEMPVLSIGRYKYTTTFLDDYSSFGVMFYLKKKWRIHCIQTIQNLGWKTTQHHIEMQTIWSWRKVPIKWAKELHDREQNWNPNVHARHSTTKWMSGKVPANHHKWSWGHAASHWLIQWFLDICCEG